MWVWWRIGYALMRCGALRHGPCLPWALGNYSAALASRRRIRGVARNIAGLSSQCPISKRTDRRLLLAGAGLDQYEGASGAGSTGGSGAGVGAVGEQQEVVLLPQALQRVTGGVGAAHKSGMIAHGLMRARLSSSTPSTTTSSAGSSSNNPHAAEATADGEAGQWEGDRGGGWGAEEAGPQGEGEEAEQDGKDDTVGLGMGGGVGLGKGGKKPKPRHGPAKAYRPDRGRVVLKMANGCKYKYTVRGAGPSCMGCRGSACRLLQRLGARGVRGNGRSKYKCTVRAAELCSWITWVVPVYCTAKDAWLWQGWGGGLQGAVV